LLTAVLGASSLHQAESQRLDSMILNLTESQDKLDSLTWRAIPIILARMKQENKSSSISPRRSIRNSAIRPRVPKPRARAGSALPSIAGRNRRRKKPP